MQCCLSALSQLYASPRGKILPLHLPWRPPRATGSTAQPQERAVGDSARRSRLRMTSWRFLRHNHLGHDAFMVLASFHLNPALMRRVAADPAQASAHLSPLLGFRLVSSPFYFLCVTVTAVALTGPVWRVVVVVALFALLENIYFSLSNLFLALRKTIYKEHLYCEHQRSRGDPSIHIRPSINTCGTTSAAGWQRPGLGARLHSTLTPATHVVAYLPL